MFKSFIALLGLFSIISCSESISTKLEKSSMASYGNEAVLNALENVNSEDEIKINTSINNDLIENREAFHIEINDNDIKIEGGSEAGILYGAKKIAEIISEENALPKNLEISESPDMDWRGISLQLMKLGEYNYAITPEEFPFFYDKTLWLEFLDFMVDQKFNYIILWNGHPFDYFVKFDKYKEAQSGMSDEQIQQNNDLLKWLIAEGGKRNIKFFFEFYNIHTSVYYQEFHKLPKEISIPTPELAAYTEYSIEKFVSEFPEIGLFITPGEGLAREHSDQWINDVLFKAIKKTGFTPTVFMRAWFFDLEHARKVNNNYSDLHFVRKFNVEMIADKRTDPENKEWAKLNGNFIVNIHMAANLEPFKWNPPSYIQDIVKNSIEDGSTGIHIHPRKAWRWPYGSETGAKEYQWKRDTLFFTAWGRYSWKADREASDDKAYWIDLLTKRYENKKAAEHFLKASEAGADVLPALQRLIWLGDSNHSIVTTGATLEQLQNASGIPFLPLKNCMSISEYVEALKTGKVIEEDTPLDFVKAKIEEARVAFEESKIAAANVIQRKDEANRIVKDAEAVVLVTQYYWNKLQALKALTLIGEGVELKKNKNLFIKYLSASVESFRKLSAVTEEAYASVSDVPAWHPIQFNKTPYHWKDLLPLYEKELEIYKKEVLIERSADFYKPNLEDLSGLIFRDADFKNPKEAYPSKEIDFDWYNDTEIGNNWSVKWFGYLKAPANGEFKIIYSADRDVILFLGDRWIELDTKEKSEIIEEFHFKEGEFYPIEVLYNHKSGEGGFIKLEWELENGQREVIPSKYFFHSESQDYKTKLMKQLKNEIK